MTPETVNFGSAENSRAEVAFDGESVRSRFFVRLGSIEHLAVLMPSPLASARI